MGTDTGTDEPQELNKQKASKTAFAQHKNMSMSAYYGAAKEETVEQEQIVNRSAKKGGSKSKEGMASYIQRTTNLTHKEDNKKYINFAYDLPNMHYLANKRFLQELA